MGTDVAQSNHEHFVCNRVLLLCRYDAHNSPKIAQTANQVPAGVCSAKQIALLMHAFFAKVSIFELRPSVWA